MNQKLTVFTQITDSYKHSAELSLCFDWLRRALPEDARWVVQEGGNASDFRETVIRNWPDEKSLVLLVREPAVLVGGRTFEEMRQILDDQPLINAVLPSDLRGFRAGREARYFTLRGFEQFVTTLLDNKDPITPYDGRDAWMLLLRSEAVRPENLPQDVLGVIHSMPTDQVTQAMNAYIHPFFNYYSEKREDVLPFVPRGIGSLLDIGCSRGGFAALVKQTLGCRVAGVEMNASEAEVAQRVLDQVWVGDAMTLKIKEKFDCITCLDMLEHLSNPEVLLEKIKTLLVPGGKFLFSVPNVGHWSIVEDLLAGRWDYVPAGIVCKTHLRFYTEYSLKKLLENQDFYLIGIHRQLSPIPVELEALFHDIRKRGINVDLSSLSTLGFVVQASINL